MCMLSGHLDKILLHSSPGTLHQHLQAPRKFSFLSDLQTPGGIEPAALTFGPCSVLRQSLACGRLLGASPI